MTKQARSQELQNIYRQDGPGRTLNTTISNTPVFKGTYKRIIINGSEGLHTVNRRAPWCNLEAQMCVDIIYQKKIQLQMRNLLIQTKFENQKLSKKWQNVAK